MATVHQHPITDPKAKAGLNFAITSLTGSGGWGNFQAGDGPTITFTLKDDAGNDVAHESVNKQFVEAPQFYTLYSLLIAGGAGLVLLPGLHLVRIMYISQVVNGLVLPVVLLYILVLANDRKVMGNYRNGLFGNAVAILTCLSVAALTLMSGLRFLF